jgi:predicted acyltransferase
MKENTVSGRMVSLDVMRGLIMILLAGESARVYDTLHELALPGPLDGLVTQFFHHPWHGLHFWDLVQPSFMMMAGTAMYISWFQKTAKGISYANNFRHIAIRSCKLFLFGTALHCVYAGKLVWELWNVLTQLSVTTLLAYAMIRRSFFFQIVAGLILIALNDVLYGVIAVPGFSQPFVEGHNFGSYMDMVLMGKINPDGWVAINCIPTAAHTIWGVAIGQWLTGERFPGLTGANTPGPADAKTPARKIKGLLMMGGLALLVGYGLDWSGITPIIKRISTGSFVLVSAGWVIWILAFLYWMIDVRNYRKWAWVATVAGMNAIFIYLFFETVGSQWVNQAIGIFVGGVASRAAIPAHFGAFMSALAAWAFLWYICFWLYHRKIFFKL